MAPLVLKFNYSMTTINLKPLKDILEFPNFSNYSKGP